VDGKIKAVLAGPCADNPLAIGPAGIAHMSVLDFARWAGWNAGQGKRGPHLVKPETLKRLHKAIVTMPTPKEAPIGTPPAGRYGLGWCEIDLDYSPNPVVYHGGSNGKNIARIWFDPQKDFAWVILTNIASAKADEGIKSLSKELFQRCTGR
jgi:CubicO group peptidase (beta-lactamase class C family)